MASSLSAVSGVVSIGFAVFFGSLDPSSGGCCGGDEHAETGPVDAIYQEGANDEALAQLDALTPPEDAARAPALTAPAAGAKVPAATPATFEWKASATGALPRRDERRFDERRFAGDAPFDPMRVAHAHGTPMNGKAYLLVIETSGQRLVRVFTTKTSYTPDAATWDKIRTAKQPIRARVIGASYDSNNLVQGSAFTGAAVELTVE